MDGSLALPEPLRLPEVELEPHTRIVADLHLDLASEEPPRAFLAWLETLRGTPRLVVLGDLFDVWVGPAQARTRAGAAVIAALHALVDRGTRLDVVHGNRDFLLDASFAVATGASVRARGLVGVLPGPGRRRALLIHGDELCTRDFGYQRLKRVVRSRPVAGLAPLLPLAVGARLAKALRRSSTRALSVKLPAEKSMQESACRELAAAHRAQVVVCGHAHAFRDVELAGGPRWIVLDAFGGARDQAEVGADGAIELGRSALP